MADLTLQRLAEAHSIEQFEMFFKKQVRAGEERLVLAVLESAVDNYQKYILHGDIRFQEAEKWLFEQDREAPFSFEYVCDALQLHPGYIRRGLLRWKKEALETKAANTNRQKVARRQVRSPSLRLRKIA